MHPILYGGAMAGHGMVLTKTLSFAVWDSGGYACHGFWSRAPSFFAGEEVIGMSFHR
jgi:hypothetical protein